MLLRQYLPMPMFEILPITFDEFADYAE